MLTTPDDQALHDQAYVYGELVDENPAIEPLVVADAPADGTAWMLSLDQRWFRCRAQRVPNGLWIWIRDCGREIDGGTSGSPILNDVGEAIGIVSTATIGGGLHGTGQSPALARRLPGWLCGSDRARSAAS